MLSLQMKHCLLRRLQLRLLPNLRILPQASLYFVHNCISQFCVRMFPSQRQTVSSITVHCKWTCRHPNRINIHGYIIRKIFYSLAVFSLLTHSSSFTSVHNQTWFCFNIKRLQLNIITFIPVYTQRHANDMISAVPKLTFFFLNYQSISCTMVFYGLYMVMHYFLLMNHT